MNKQALKIVILSVVLVVFVAIAALLYKYVLNGYDSASDATEEATEAVAETVAETREINLTADFSVTDKDGNTVKLSDFFGKPIVINFWATWCPNCVAKLPDFETAHSTYGDEVAFMIVNVGDAYSKAFSHIESNGYTFPAFHDSFSDEAAVKYGASLIPMTVFISADGELVSTRVGAIPYTELEKEINAIR